MKVANNKRVMTTPTTLYVDTAYCTVGQEGGNFVLDLGGQGIEIKDNTKLFCDDFTFVHAWDSIQKDKNDRMFLLSRWNPGRLWHGTYTYVDSSLTVSEFNQAATYFTNGSTQGEIPLLDDVTFVSGAILDADTANGVLEFGLSGLPDLTGVVF